MKKMMFLLLSCMISLFACTQENTEEIVDSFHSSENSNLFSESFSHQESDKKNEEHTITFVKGVDDLQETRGDKYNYYAIEGKADGFDKVIAIIEGTAIDFRNTDNLWRFDYPYPASTVETDITFTTASTIEYGETGIELNSLHPSSYRTIHFIPNETPTVEEPSVTVNEGETHTFSNEEQGIVETVTITSIEVVDADPKLNPLGDKLLKVDLLYVNEGTATTYMAPNYYLAIDGQMHFLPLLYSHFWLKEVAPGQSFIDTIYYDVTSSGPYMVKFFDGAWLDTEGLNETTI